MNATNFDGAARARLEERCSAAGSVGAIAAASPVAAAIGTSILRRGGNCVDAALAAALAETVLLAPKCGLAGDLVALYRAPDKDEPIALIAIGESPAALGAAVLREGKLPATGGLAVGIPGAPAGYEALSLLAQFPLEELVAPALSLAERGFAWSPWCAELAGEADELLMTYQPSGCTYRPIDGPLSVGTHVSLPGLAIVLREFAAKGGAVFHGALGEAIANRVQSVGGVLVPEDFLNAAATWCEPVSIRRGDGTRVFATPGPSYGPALLASLARAEHGSASVLIDAVRDTLDEQSKTGLPPSFDTPDGTSCIAAADMDGGVVVVVHSNSFPQFGAGVVVDELDLVLANRAGRGFSADPSNQNFPAPGRRPLTTLHAWSVHSEHDVLFGATSGGIHQVGWNAQFLTEMFSSGATSTSDNCFNPAHAVMAPMWRLESDRVIAESDITLDDVTIDFERVAPLSMSSSQVIARPGSSDNLATAWADPRHEAIALAV